MTVRGLSVPLGVCWRGGVAPVAVRTQRRRRTVSRPQGRSIPVTRLSRSVLLLLALSSLEPLPVNERRAFGLEVVVRPYGLGELSLHLEQDPWSVQPSERT